MRSYAAYEGEWFCQGATAPPLTRYIVRSIAGLTASGRVLAAGVRSCGLSQTEGGPLEALWLS